MYRSFYDSPYDAFTNYMNILGDFLKRVRDMFSDAVENDELNSLYTQIANMDEELNTKENEISRLCARLDKYEPKSEHAPEAGKPVPEKSAPTSKKTTAKKPVAKKNAK